MAQQLLTAVAEVIRSAVGDNAHVAVESKGLSPTEHLVSVTPHAVGAAPLSVLVDESAGQVYLTAGVFTPFEFSRRGDSLATAEFAEVIEGVVGGRFKETVLYVRGQPACSSATLWLGDAQREVRHWTGRALLPSSRRRATTKYAPYC